MKPHVSKQLDMLLSVLTVVDYRRRSFMSSLRLNLIIAGADILLTEQFGIKQS
jgi:hypothetical protein